MYGVTMRMASGWTVGTYERTVPTALYALQKVVLVDDRLPDTQVPVRCHSRGNSQAVPVWAVTAVRSVKGLVWSGCATFVRCASCSIGIRHGM